MNRLLTIFVTTLINISFSLVYAQPVQAANQTLRAINYHPKLATDISNYLGDYKLVNISLGANQEICLLVRLGNTSFTANLIN
jgi:hypothetical protein